MEDYINIIVVLLAILLDLSLGDPRWLPHPIVLMGKSIAWFEKKLNKGKNKQQKGLLTVVILVFICYLGFAAMSYFMQKWSFWAVLIFETIFTFTALAGTSLIRECKKVFTALNENLEAGRLQISYLVGRDTSQLNEQEIKTATLETLSENLSDGVIAPLFWFAVGGVPAMLSYKMINTLDSMIGYKTERYKDFGKAAALLDDLANYIPARLTAVLMAITACSKRSFRFIKKYGKSHSSPNAGYPESALAGILNVQFGGGHVYHGEWIDKPKIGSNKRKILFADLQKSISINRRVEFSMVLIIILLDLIFISLA